MRADHSDRHSPEQVTFDLNQAKLNAAIVTGEANPVVDIRCIAERPGTKGPPKLFRGRLSNPALIRQLKMASKAGYAVFYTPNATDGKGVKRENVTENLVVPLDLDESPLPDIWAGPTPALITETSPGRHQAFFAIEPTTDNTAAENIARRVANHYGGDSAVCDAGHIFRLAGFPHWKTGEPHLCRIVKAVDPADVLIDHAWGRHSLDEFDRLPPLPDKGEQASEPTATVAERMSADDLKSLLDHVDVFAFDLGDDNSDTAWRRLCTACVAATGGTDDAMHVFQDWCGGNPEYADDEQQAEIATRWKSFKPDRPGGITAGTLYHICREQGVPSDVTAQAFKRTDAVEDFAKLDAENDGTLKLVALGQVDPSVIPLTPWHIKGVTLAGAAMCLVGPGSAGKSLFVLMLACMIATGKQFGPWELKTKGQRKVLLLLGEDDQDENERRLVVVCDKMGIKRADLGDRVTIPPKFTNMVLVKRGPDGGVIKTKLWHMVRRTILQTGIGFVGLDPFVRVHSGFEESNNEDMAQVVAALAELVHASDCSLLIVHHTTKTGSPDDMNSARGAGAFIYATRGGNTFFPMSFEEWRKLKPGKSRFSFVRVTSVKANYDAKGQTHWFELSKGQVGNGEERVGLVPRNLTAAADFADLQEFSQWDHAAAFLKLVKDGRPNTAKAGKPSNAGPWLTSDKAMRGARLAPAMMAEPFNLSEQDAMRCIAHAEQDGHLIRIKAKTKNNRHGAEAWAVADTAKKVSSDDV